MSEEMVSQILKQVQALPRGEKTKFHVYKGRYIEKGQPEADAIVAAAAKVGVKTDQLLTPLGGAVSSSVTTDSGVITEGISSDDDTHEHDGQAPVITDANTPLPLLAAALAQGESRASEYHKVINFPRLIETERHVQSGPADQNEPRRSLKAAASEPQAHYLVSPAPAVSVSLKSQSISWEIGVSSDSKQANTGMIGIREKAIIQTAVCSVAVSVCTFALTYYGAIAAGGTSEAWFWSAFCEITGFSLLVAPMQGLVKKSFVRAIGLGVLALGYFTMHTSIAGDTHKSIAQVVSSDSEVQILEKRIERMRSDLTIQEQNIAAYDPEKYR